jgi:hypothetical protein
VLFDECSLRRAAPLEYGAITQIAGRGGRLLEDSAYRHPSVVDGDARFV